MKDVQVNELLEMADQGGASLRGETSAARVLEISALDVLRIRQSHRLLRPEFAQLLGVSVSTLQSWEQGRQKPSGAACILLRVFEKHPMAVFDVVQLGRPARKAFSTRPSVNEKAVSLKPQVAAPPMIEEEIERLYDKIIALSKNAEPGSALDTEIDRAYARLLELQTAEAQKFREHFEASLDMPINAGAQILARARALREELEDLTASDTATSLPDDPQASPAAG